MGRSVGAASRGRCTDPENFQLVGVPPKDLVSEVATALGDQRKEVFEKCVRVCGEWDYHDDKPNAYFQHKYRKERSIPMKHKTLEETLNPQPAASRVLTKLLGWIDRVDLASQGDLPRPPFLDDHGSSIFPAEGESDERWWLTELSRHKEDEKLSRISRSVPAVQIKI